jgi:4-amino-4-deoxy-L-arabinose transferase-like glycosyltransferase
MPLRPSPAGLVRVALLLPVLLLLGRLGLFVTHSADMITFPWQIDFDEGVILHSSWLLAQGQTPYPPPGADHFISSVYPPLFYALNAVALKLAGLNLWSGRALSLLGALLAGGALIWWTVAETRSRLAGVVAAACWLALGPVIVWATFYKQDILALGLGALGGAMVAAGVAGAPGAGARLPRRAWWAILPLILAFWTKQSTLAPLAAGALFLLARDWRSGLRWSLAAGVALIGPFLLATAATRGQLYAHLFYPSAEPLSGARLGKNLEALWIEHWPVVVLAAGVAVALLAGAARARTGPPLSVWYAAISVPAMLITNMSPLANYNHLLIGLLPVCLLAGVGLGRAVALAGSGWRAAAPALATLALLVAQSALFTPIKNWYTPLGQPLAEKAARYEALAREVAAAPGSAVLGEDAWLALKAGKTLPYDDPAMMAIQANSGRWDQSGFLADIARRKFGLLILEHDITGETFTPRWSPAALAALQANYATKYRDVRFLQAPAAPPAAPPAARDCALAGGPRLVGVFLPGGAARLDAGDAQALSLYWAAPAAGAAPQPALKFSLRLAGATGAPVWQADLPPGGAAGQPWPAWPPGAAPRDDFLAQVPRTAAPGAYTLTLSAYTQQGDQFTPVAFTCKGAAPSAALTLATPEVAAPWGATSR